MTIPPLSESGNDKTASNEAHGVAWNEAGRRCQDPVTNMCFGDSVAIVNAAYPVIVAEIVAALRKPSKEMPFGRDPLAADFIEREFGGADHA